MPTAAEEFLSIINETVPNATPGIAYGMDCFMYKGKPVGSLVEAKKHIGFYPMSGSIVEQFKEELKEYSTSKGTVRFPLGKPLPKGIIKKMLLARIKEIDESLG